MSSALLEMRGITKRFPGVVAMDGVSFSLNRGEIVALVGENGAGKSTLMKILGGLYRPDEGCLNIDDKPVSIGSVRDAHRLGVAFIHQELNVHDNIDIAGNIFLGREPLRAGPLRLIDRTRINQDARVLMARLGLHMSPTTLLSTLSIGQRQLVEIAKALSTDARILIMDEPTSSLTLPEAERLLRVARELKQTGVSIIYISHRLREVKQVADRVTVLRDGKNSGELQQHEISHDAMVQLMVGRDIDVFHAHPATAAKPGYFEINNFKTARYPSTAVNLAVSQGEILGMAGLIGAGRSELAHAIFGVDRPVEGNLKLEGKTIPVRSPTQAIANGIYLIPEDRREHGLITAMSVRENITLPTLDRHTKGGFIFLQSEQRTAQKQCSVMKIKTPSTETIAMTLSGGNQQKLVLSKWISLEPKLIIFDEPTRGIDVGAKSEIYRLMHDLAQKGVAIIMISSDMEEILGISDRVAVMHEGIITGILDRNDCSEESIMRLATGTDAFDQSKAEHEIGA